MSRSSPIALMLLLACSGGQTEPAASESETESASESESETASASESETASESESETASESASDSDSESAAESESGSETPPEPGTLRLVVAHDGPELLGSESRQIDALREGLAREHTVDAAAATEAERSWLTDGGALPEGWGRFETVVALRVAEPQTLRRSGRRVSRGLLAVHVLRPPTTEPIYTQEGGPVGLSADKELEWIGTLLGALDEGESE